MYKNRIVWTVDQQGETAAQLGIIENAAVEIDQAIQALNKMIPLKHDPHQKLYLFRQLENMRTECHRFDRAAEDWIEEASLRELAQQMGESEGGWNVDMGMMDDGDFPTGHMRVGDGSMESILEGSLLETATPQAHETYSGQHDGGDMSMDPQLLQGGMSQHLPMAAGPMYSSEMRPTQYHAATGSRKHDQGGHMPIDLRHDSAGDWTRDDAPIVGFLQRQQASLRTCLVFHPVESNSIQHRRLDYILGAKLPAWGDPLLPSSVQPGPCDYMGLQNGATADVDKWLHLGAASLGWDEQENHRAETPGDYPEDTEMR